MPARQSLPRRPTPDHVLISASAASEQEMGVPLAPPVPFSALLPLDLHWQSQWHTPQNQLLTKHFVGCCCSGHSSNSFAPV